MSELICTCGCHKKEPHAYHEFNCPMRDHADSLKAKIKNMIELDNHNTKALNHWILVGRMWEGKFHAVKRENNALRKKLFPNK